MTPKVWHKEMLGKKVVESLKKNNFKAQYVSTKEEALNLIIELIPKGSTIGKGGSMTMKEINVYEELGKRGYEIYDHHKEGLSPEEKAEILGKQQTCDCFLTSTNALTLDGKLVNMDGVGNRVSAMIFGPKKVIVVTGTNKIVKNVDSAIERIQMWVSPMNNKRLGKNNPCVKTGVCMDCQGPERICNITTIISQRPQATDIEVIVVGEDLGY